MIYKCSVCGYIFDEDKEKMKLSELSECPLCKQPADKFVPAETKKAAVKAESGDTKEDAEKGAEPISLEYPKETRKTDADYRYMKEIHEMAVTGKSRIEAMGTRMPMPNWDDILVLGAQLDPMPLEEHAPVSTMTVIGKHAKSPMVLGTPVYISHMSFGDRKSVV